MVKRYLNPEEPLILVVGFCPGSRRALLSYGPSCWAVDCIMPFPQLAALLLALLPALLPY